MSQLQPNIEACKNPYGDSNSHDYDIDSNVGFSYDFKWEGIILEIKDKSIIARLIESTTNEEDKLVFPISKIPSDDLSLVGVGALFNFYVGYSNSKGTIKNADFIKFRRKTIDRDDLDEILDSMKEIDFDSILEDY